MRISDVSIKNPVFAWMLMSALIIFGAISFSRMGVSQLPDVDFPVVSVNLTLEGAAPEIMETTVIDVIENALMTVQGVRSLSSTSKQGSGTITVEFDLDKNIDVAVQEIQTKVAQSQRLLPKDIDPPTITKTNPDDQPIIWLAVTTTNPDPRYLMTFARDWLKDQFLTVSGVGDIFLGGYVDPNLRVWVKPQELRKYNISVNDIINSISTEHSELPGGQIETDTKNYNVRTMGEAKSVEEFGNIIISQRAGSLTQDPFNIVRLKQVADIEEGLADVSRLSRFNGVPALGLGVRKQKGSNAVDVAKAVKKKIAEVAPNLPKDIQLNVNFDSTQFIEDAIHELNFTLIISALLTAFACWVFLGSWSATLNVVLAIPTSIMGSFIVLYFLGFTLNTFTLLGLSLAIGIVVDDAIMVLENIFRHQEKGKGRIEAAIVGAREITFAAMAATVAIIAIFLPVAFMKGAIGKFFLQYGVTITVAVLLSLLEALTITPMRSAQFGGAGHRSSRVGLLFDHFMEWCRVNYDRTLRVALNHRVKVLVGAVVFMLASFVLVKFVNKEFSPAQDQSIFLVRLQSPAGSSLPYMDGLTKQAEKFLMERGEVKQVYAAIGGFGGGAGGETNTSMMFVTMKPKKERPRSPETGKPLSQQDFMDIVRKNLSQIKDLKPVIQDLSMRGFTASRGFPIEFTLRGADWDKLAELMADVQKQMADTGLMTDIDSNYLLGMPEVQITPDRKAAAMHGITINQIGTTVNALIGGVKVGEYPKNGHRYDIRVQIRKEFDKVEEIKNLLVGNARSNLIPMSQVVTQDIRSSLQSISRIDRQRAISIYANLKPGASQQDAISKITEIASKLPNGYTIGFSGSAQTFKESFQSLIFALLMGIVVAYMVLATQFNSFIDPVSVLIALPFSISGAFFALLMSGQSLNIYSMIGIILLMGIVKKNSILLVEFTNVTREHDGGTVNESLIKACPVRLRPILMTSFATIVGAIPGAIAFGPGSETRIPMSITIIGGVLVSTILTLYVVPCFYSLLSRFQKRDANQEKTKLAFASVGE